MGKKKKYYKIPILIIFGLIIMYIFYMLFGGMMLLRYLLGALLFATITTFMVKWLNGTFGKKCFKI
jgi:4-amino-4-deoxy-L-arabinose transferase-like glycosyltransferase